ncbi:MAG TPA: hypothetical protein PK367_02455 [Candidatus Paceibacterota bacterium]|nr:hypothetical protein [Candidatus Paceibacterota bacterium]
MILLGKKYIWTKHAEFKMKFWQLSESRVRRVIHSPLRVEEGIAPDTVAMMQPVSYKTKGGVRSWNQEIWVMVSKNQKEKNKNKDNKKERENDKNKNSSVRIISAWRYPGVTKPGAPLPQEIINEIKEAAEIENY